MLLTFDQKKRAWLLAARPKTLTASIGPILVATALSFQNGFTIDWIIFFASLLSSFLIQIATNYLNDAYDFLRGADKNRIGPERMSQNGLLNPYSMIYISLWLLILAFILAIPLIYKGGMIVALMVSLSILSAYLYTGSRYPLAYQGLGEIFVILFFGIFNIPVFYYLQTFTFSLNSFIAGIQIGCLCAVIISINNLRDLESDRKVNKKTLAVRFGKKFAKIKILLLLYIPYILTFFYLSESLIKFFLPFLTIFLAIPIHRNVLSNSVNYNIPFFQAAKVHFIFCISLSLSLILH